MIWQVGGTLHLVRWPAYHLLWCGVLPKPDDSSAKRHYVILLSLVSAEYFTESSGFSGFRRRYAKGRLRPIGAEEAG
jgi:hypothetical protein